MLVVDCPMETPKALSPGDPKEAIVAIVSRKEMALPELLRELKSRGIDDQALAKAALWSLIAESAVELTPRRSLRRRY
jgi:hypothetical protein